MCIIIDEILLHLEIHLNLIFKCKVQVVSQVVKNFINWLHIQEYNDNSIFIDNFLTTWYLKLNSRWIFERRRIFFNWWKIGRRGGSKFGTTKCRTADISEFLNFEYKNNESRIIRFLHFWIYFLLLRLLKLFEHSKYMYDNLLNSKFLEFW